eukprot:JP447140.1.p1 GENE.JP447140.1~~JP447140.1.p1  ORF type:complete len:145 (+),score=29.78 JP447140.1:22-435(+)
MSWSTGLLGAFDDFEVFMYASTGAAFLLPAHYSVDVYNGSAAFGLPGAKIGSTFKSCGCTERDGACLINGALLECFAPIWIFYRGALREKYSIEGSLLADVVVFCCCPICGIMQDAREMKKRGGGGFTTPAPQMMER